MAQKLHRDKRLEENLNCIYQQEVALEVEHESKRQLLMSLLEVFTDYCYSKCPIFVKYFRHFYLTGSYFEGLRVKEATEFDINVVFELPLYQGNYMVDELDMLPSFATIQLESVTDVKEVPFFDKKGFILKRKLLQWFQSLLDSFLNTDKFHYPGVVIMKSSHSGPARTVKVFYKTVWISIDLVPVFHLNVEYLQKFTNFLEFCQSTENAHTCYVVPKPLKPELACLVPEHNPEQVWRIHFPEAEKYILRKKDKLKCVIQLAKALRDKQDWSIPSYFLKIVALRLVEIHPQKKFWSKHSIDTLFYLFLEALERHLSTKFLGHIFYPSFNLFSALSITLLQDLNKRVKKILQRLKRHPDSAFTLFKVSDCSSSSAAPSLLRY